MCSSVLLALATAFMTTATAAVELPGIRILPSERRIEVEAVFAIVDDAYYLEYLAVSPQGKAHESLLQVSCEPEKLQFGLLAIGLEPKGEVQFHGEALELKGPRTIVEIEWGEGEARKRVHAEDVLFDVRFGAPMKRGGFAFTGSRFIQGWRQNAQKQVFAATSSGSVIAIYHDPDAILDNPSVSGGDIPLIAPTFALPEVVTWVPGDERIRPLTKSLPPHGTKAILHLRPAK